MVATWFAAAGDGLRRAGYERWLREDQTKRKEHRMAGLPQDVRYAIRGFTRQRGTTLLLLGTLGLGMAAAIGVFGLINGVVLRPLPFPESTRLVYLNETAPTWNLTYTGINYPDFHQWRPRLRGTFAAVGIYGTASVNLADPGGAQRVRTAQVTHDLPAALGIQPLLGRTFSAEEDRLGGPKVVVLVETLWRSRFGLSRDVLGQSLTIDGLPHTIIGVLPRTASFIGESELWTPLQEDPTRDGQSYAYEGIGRLEEGTSVEGARAALLAAHAPVWAASDTARIVSPVLVPLRDFLSADYRTLTIALAAGAVLVLLCACANVASTMLARAIFRQREIGVRIALGANPKRITRQLMVESVTLAAAAGVVGAVLGQWGLSAFGAATAEWLPSWIHLEPTWSTALAAIGLVGGTSILFGLAPAVTARRIDGRPLLGGADRRASLGRGERRLLHGFVVAEVFLATILLSASGMLFRAQQRVRAVDPGIRTEQVLTFRLELPAARYPDSVAIASFHRRLEEALSAIPGARETGVATCVPLTRCHNGNFFEAEGAPPRAVGAANPVTLTLGMSPGAMAALGIRVTRGRGFTPADGETGPLSTLVSEDFARLHWPGIADPTGRRIRFAGSTSARWRTVVGVVGNVRHYGLDQPTRPTVYFPAGPATAAALNGFAALVRTAGPIQTVAEPVRAAVRQIDPELAVYGWQSMEDALGKSLGIRRILGAVLAFFAAVALVLAVGGLYGVLSYVVGRRRGELGLRMALGARPGQVVGLVVNQGVRLAAIGWLLGTPLVFWLGRMLGDRLVGVRPFEPAVVGAVAVVIALTGIVASAVPGRRAALVEPRASLLAD
jgi:predicted permease